MSFAEAQARLQQAVFDRLGEDATWTGVDAPVRVIRREYDEEGRFDVAVQVPTVRRLRVRKSEVPVPADGDEAQILDALGEPVDGAFYRVAGEPQLDRKGVWTCPVILA